LALDEQVLGVGMVAEALVAGLQELRVADGRVD
jgi:hypothetical protein